MPGLPGALFQRFPAETAGDVDQDVKPAEVPVDRIDRRARGRRVGQIDPAEDPGGLSARCLAECRERAPIAVGGRRRTEAKWRAAVEAERAASEG